MQALVALGELALQAALDDPDPRIERAGAMGALGLPATARRAGAEAAPPRDAAARRCWSSGSSPGSGGAATVDLIERARGGGPDAPLAALALSARDDDAVREAVDGLLQSRDPVIRAHAARGLGRSTAPDAVGRLARAYLFEPELQVRRALVAAMAGLVQDAGAPRAAARRSASRHELDPDRHHPGDGHAAPLRPRRPGSDRHATRSRWLRIVPAAGAAAPQAMTAMVVGADGLARPIVFDDDGYALVPGLPSGEATLRLAPRLPAYDSP